MTKYQLISNSSGEIIKHTWDEGEATEHQWLLWFYQNCDTTTEWDAPLIALMKQFEEETGMRVPREFR